MAFGGVSKPKGVGTIVLDMVDDTSQIKKL